MLGEATNRMKAASRSSSGAWAGRVAACAGEGGGARARLYTGAISVNAAMGISAATPPPLLRFGQHYLVRAHTGFPLRHEVHIDLDPGPSSATHFGGRARQPGRAHILD